MAWRIVRQPNGLLARFSDIVDSFTVLGMTVEEAYQECLDQGAEPPVALEKLAAAVFDHRPWGQTPSDHPLKLARWEYDLDTIRSIHGETDAQEMVGVGTERPVEPAEGLEIALETLRAKVQALRPRA